MRDRSTSRPNDAVRPAAPPLPRDARPESWASGTLEWHRTNWLSTEWELRADGQTIATLAMRGAIRERTVGRGPSGDWEIRHRWTGAAEIARPGDGEAVAAYQPGWWRGGVITTASSLRYLWTTQGFWRPEYVIATESGFPCVRFRRLGMGRRRGCTVIVETAGMRLPELEALVLLGWRLVVATTSRSH